MKIDVMKKVFAALSVLIFAGAAFAGAGTNNFPQSAGGTLPHAPGGNLILGGVSGNPALLGVRQPPYRAFTLVPTSAAVYGNLLELPALDWNSEHPLRIKPFSDFPAVRYDSLIISGSDTLIQNVYSSFEDYRNYFLKFFPNRDTLNTMSGFREYLSKELDGNPLSLYFGMQTAPFVYTSRGFGLILRTYADAEIRLPEDLLLLNFVSPIDIVRDSLIRQREGLTLDFSSLDIEAIWATEIGAKVGFSRKPFGFLDRIGLDRMAFGAGLKVILGHSYFKMEAEDNTGLVLDTTDFSNPVTGTGKITITEIGANLSGARRYGEDGNPDDSTHLNFLRRPLIPINGQGWGLDLGTAFYNDRHFLSVDVADIGMILWNIGDVYHRTVYLDSMYNSQTLAGVTDFNNLLNIDSLEYKDSLVITWLPMSANLGYTYFYDIQNRAANAFLGYFSIGGNYRQQILLGPGRSTYFPRLSGGATLGLFGGIIPVRYGMVYGGQEELAAAIGAGLDLKYFSLDASYKEIGTAFPAFKGEPKKGYEVAVALNFKWRHKDHKFERVDEEPPPPPPTPVAPPDTAVPPLPELPDFPEWEDVPLEMMELEEVEYEVVLDTIWQAPPPMPEPEPEPVLEPTPEAFSTAQRAINFRSGGAELTPGSAEGIHNVAALINAHPEVRYEIQGHTDSQGSEALNMRLSMRRALAVKNALIAAGVPAENIIAIGYGPTMPIADNATVQGRALNRRVEFIAIESQERYDALRLQEAALIQNFAQ